MIHGAEKTLPNYRQLPHLSNLTDASIDALKRRGATIAQIHEREGIATLEVPILRWQSLSRDIVDFASMMADVPAPEVNDTEPSLQAPLGELRSEVEMNQSLIVRIGSLTDQEFRHYFFESAENEAYLQRKTGEQIDRELIESASDHLGGRLREYFSRPDSLLGQVGGLEEHLPQYQLQPREHMLWVVANVALDDAPLTSREKGIVRLAAIVHDIEKAVLSRTADHPEISAAMVRSLLLGLRQLHPDQLSNTDVDAIVRFVEVHHLIQRLFEPLKESQVEKLRQAQRLTLLGELAKRFPNVDHGIDDEYLNFVELLTRYYQRLRSIAPSRSGFSLGNQNDRTQVEQHQLKRLLEQVAIAAQHNGEGKTLRQVSLVVDWLDYREKYTPGLLLGLIHFIEADIVTSDKPSQLVEEFLQQLTILEQGLVSTVVET